MMSTPFGDNFYIVGKIKYDEWQAQVQTIDANELASFAYQMAALYKQRAASFLPSGPLPMFLL